MKKQSYLSLGILALMLSAVSTLPQASAQTANATTIQQQSLNLGQVMKTAHFK
ncbi:hypothetical protein GOP56_10880 [Brevibacillus sp. 7WMA2]|uniref:hypothetical protein n=1 Tax=Brevibacillus TaxID=55080 RepID=UPI0013A714D7|nr:MULTISPECIES: hypothetical protein [Brevibacillus]MCR8995574.1 hypothetical protein [Brevibacillus laterosporus]QIC06072.1 hypothetical protein GOP56_10880 [Brevibacillus sp. 7WMA2]WPS87007.1 hypothetical protein SMD22_21285 [Brevibacillus halotolerans]